MAPFDFPLPRSGSVLQPPSLHSKLARPGFTGFFRRCVAPSAWLAGLLLLFAAVLPAQLQAQATAPVVALGSVNLGASATGTVTFTFSAQTTVGSISVLTQGATGKDFQLNTAAPGSCAATTYSASATCTVGVKFSPLTPGLRLGAAVLLDSNGNKVVIGTVTGVGSGGLAALPLTAAPSSSLNTQVEPDSVAYDGAGNLYAAEFSTIHELKADGTSTSFVLTYPGSNIDIYGLAVDGAGVIYAAETEAGQIVRFDPAIGASSQNTFVSMTNPYALAFDPAGTLFVTDYNGIEKISSTGAVTTVYSEQGNSFIGIGFDPAGNLYYETGNGGSGGPSLVNSIYKIPAGQTQPVLIYQVSACRCTYLFGFAVDAASNLYYGSYTQGVYEIPAGTATPRLLRSSSLYQTPVALSGTGLIAFSSSDPVIITSYNRLAQSISAPAGTATAVGATSAAQSVTVENDGNAALNFSAFTGAGAAAATSGYTCAVGTPVAVDATCTLGVQFAPTAHGTPQTGTLTVAGNTPNSVVSITGDVTGDPVSLYFSTPPPASLQAGQNAGTVVVSIVDNAGGPTASTASVTLTVTGPSSYFHSYTVSAVNGQASFDLSGATLTTKGSYSYSATSAGLNSASDPEAVTAGPAVQLTATAAFTSRVVGQADTVTVSAFDTYGNVASSSDTVNLSTADTAATGTGTLTLSNGTGSKAITFNTAGTYTVTATDTTNPGVAAGTTASITVLNVPVYTVTTAIDPATGTAANCPDQANGGAASNSCSLRDAFAAVTALNNASTSSYVPTINFAPSLYGQTLTMTAAQSVTGNVSLVGPGAGASAITLSGNNAVVFLTAGGTAVTNFTGLTFSNFKGTQSTVLIGTGTMTFTNDTFSNNTFTGSNNGGVMGVNGAITVTGCAFTGNTASNAGGAFASTQTSLTISNSLFSGNTAGTNGGALALYGTGAVNITNTAFVNNKASVGNGGAVFFNTTAPLTLTSGTFNGNTATVNGGAIYLTGLYTISNSSFTGNAISGASTAIGGALYGSNTGANIIRSTNFIGNSASTSAGTAEGGALYAQHVNMTNVLFSGSYLKSATSSFGGAAYMTGNYTNYWTGVTLTGNCTAPPSTATPPVPCAGTGATTQDGGAVYQTTASINNLYNVTVSRNSAKIGGGWYKVNGSLNAYNSVISGNTATASYSDVSTGVTTNSNSYVPTSTTATCSGNCAPLLSALGSYGGGTVGAVVNGVDYTTPVQTMVPLPGSPLLAAGSANYLYPTAANAGTVTCNGTALETEARGCGYGRSTSYNGSSHVDIGAAEANYSLSWLQQPTSTRTASNFTPAPTVQLYESGVPFAPGVTGGTLNFSAASGTLSAGTAPIGSTGLATLTASIGTPQANDTLIATAKSSASGTPTVATATSSLFNITDPAAASINYVAPPAYNVVNGGNAGVVKVGLYSNAGTLDGTATSTVTLTVTASGYTTATYNQPAVNGVATFDLSNVPLTVNGTYTYTATSTYTTDTVTATETVASQVIGSFVLSGIPSAVYPGSAYSFTVTAKDTTGATFTGFTGPVFLTSTDPLAAFLPQDYTFSASDAGTHTFRVSFNTAGTQTVTATTNGGATGSETGIVVDGYVWLLNGNGTTTKLTATGNTVYPGVGMSSSNATQGGIAPDSAGNIWSVTSASNALDFVSYTGTGASAFTGGGLNAPAAVAVDGSGNVWVANSGNNSVSLFTNSGTAVSPATNGFTGCQTASGGACQPGSYGSPSGVAIDVSGNVWVTNSSTNTVTEILGAAAPVAPAATAITNGTTGARP